MSASSSYLPGLHHPLGAAIRWLCLYASLGLVTHGLAQSVTYSNPSVPLVPRAIQKAAPADSSTSSDSQNATTLSPIEFGQFRLHPQLHVSYLHTDGLPSGPGTSINSEMFTFAPSLAAEVGETLTLNFAPIWTNYSDKSMQDSVSQFFALNWGKALDAWTLHFTESFQSSSDVLAETAQQTKQHGWATVLAGERKLGNRSTYDGTISLNERYGDQFADSRTWSLQQFLKMQFSPKVDAGLGLDLGYVDIDRQPDMKYEQYLGDLTWKPTAKLSLTMQGGIEIRHSQAAGTANIHNPIMDLSLGYQPFDHTHITLARTRTVENSYYNNALTKNSGWSVSLNQRLLEKLTLNLSYNHQSSEYFAFGTSTPPTSTVSGRSDDINSFNASISVQLFQRWTLAAIYHSSKNDSNQSGFQYTTTQYGMELSGRF